MNNAVQLLSLIVEQMNNTFNYKMRRPDPKYIRLAVIIAAVLFVILLIGGYIAYTKREAILQHELVKAKAKAKSQYHLDLNIGSAHFTGLSTITCNNITIVPEGRDTLLNISHFDVRIKLLPLLFGKIKLANVDLQNGHLNLTDIKGVKNFDFLFKKKKDSTATHKADLSELSNNLINEVLYKIPDNLGMNNFLLSYTNDSTSFKILTKIAKIDDGDLTSTIKVNDTATWHFAGTMH